MTQNNLKRVILDVDAGIDDIFAILALIYAVKIKVAKIEAITLTYGNAPLLDVTKNVVRILELLDQTDIPIYAGAREGLITSDTPFIPLHFGKDGFCDIPHEKQPNLSIIKNKVAAVAINEIVMQNPGEISLICVGPLTNIALTTKLFSAFMDNVKEIFIFGGNYQAVGNTPMTAEYNFFMDPEAAHIVLKNSKSPVTILPYETVLHHAIDINWRFNYLGAIKSPCMELLNKAETILHSSRHAQPRWSPFDLFLTAAALFPHKIVTETQKVHVTVELAGTLTRGQMVLSRSKEKQPNASMIKGIDIEAFKSVVYDIMSKVL